MLRLISSAAENTATITHQDFTRWASSAKLPSGRILRSTATITVAATRMPRMPPRARSRVGFTPASIMI